MSFTVHVLFRARVDVDSIHDWIAKRSPGGAVRWYTAFLEAAAGLRESPGSCGLAPESASLQIGVRQRFFRTRRGGLHQEEVAERERWHAPQKESAPA
ncbi:MAG: hypothetical protein HY721_29650 [Planctomycetes bacterium]|nr:hypothetical protein [Planctomycetota bacterium]